MSKMLKLDEVPHENVPVASPCRLCQVSFLLYYIVGSGRLRFSKIWKECDYTEGAKLLCGPMQISHNAF